MRRLLEEPLAGRAATLLRSAAADVPPRSAEQKDRILATLSAATTSSQTSGRLARASSVRLLSLVIAAAGVVGTGYCLFPTPGAHGGPPAPELPAVSTVGAPELAPTGAVPAPAAEPRPEGVDVMALPSAPVDPRAAAPLRPASQRALLGQRPPARAGTASASAQPLGLQDELAALDAARAATVDQHPALALRRIESYRRRFPTGNFVAEIDALEVQALFALGRNHEARALAERFLSERPDSPYTQRVRSVINLAK